MIDVVEALGHVNLGVRDEVFYTCRALLVHRPEQLAVFDLAFDKFWRQQLGRPSSSSRQATSPAEDNADKPSNAPHELVADVGTADGPGDASSQSAVRTWSDRGGLSGKDFAALTAAEIADADRLVAPRQSGGRRTRRWCGRTADRPQGAPSASLRTSGDIVTLKRRTRRIRPRPLVLLCDVSGSMGYLACSAFRPRSANGTSAVEAFLFSTELTRIA
jgi:uncharacterized protein with von Willebrand factor type A (vWA) domain